MKNKKREQVISNAQDNIFKYWDGVSKEDIVHIKTKRINGFYVQKEPEEFRALQLPNRPLLGLKSDTFIRLIRCDRPTSGIIILYKKHIDTINGESLEPVDKEWVVQGTKPYTIKYTDGKFTCTCPAFIYRRQKHCKHILKIQSENKL